MSRSATGFALPRPSTRLWWYAIGLVLLAYLLVSQHEAAGRSLAVLARADWRWVVLAVAVTFSSHATAALKYQLLALSRIRYVPTLLIQLAGLLTSRLLPAGIGGVGVNYLYLRHARHSKSQAAAVVSMNSALGFVGHGLLVVLIVGGNGERWRQVLPRFHWRAGYLVLAVVTITLAVVFAFLYRRNVRRIMRDLRRHVSVYSRRPAAMVGGVAYSVLIALFYTVALVCSAKALGVPLPFFSALIVLTTGIVVGTVSPTPGGLVGAEAGLAAALLAYGIRLSDALAVTILFRLVTFWMSVAVGAAALVAVERERLI